MATNTRRFYGKELEDVLGLANVNALANTTDPHNSYELKQIPVQTLIPGKYQPRRQFDERALAELAQSIVHNGILQPIIVRPASENHYEIIAGERRWRAAQIAKLANVPVIIYQLSDESALAVGLIENIQRKNLNPIEEALALQRLIDEFSVTHERVAKMVGRSRTMVTNMLRLLNLAEAVKKLLIDNKIEMGHARCLLSLSEGQQISAGHIIVSKNLTVRQTEKLVKQFLSADDVTPQLSVDDRQTQQWQQALSKLLATCVQVRSNQVGKGQIIINFDNLQQAAELIRMITANNQTELLEYCHA